ncbi:hypothetical protein RhiirA4_486009 [Rhizophagus irregularis]|uniref:Protein kinase domain-containing protein n=1 Tax=Rhizophagus irregularis TaxID=588596 RepID=A0A2I1HQU9_9GLOM|nr:hypothetical protein RhiirA4_486009 [Rhizophagus irregularis]
MWEISSGQPPFINYEHNYDLAMHIVNGIRPKIVSGTPLEYINLMKQCWDADPSKRPDIGTLLNEIDKLNLYYQTKSNELLTQLEEDNNLEINNVSSLENYTNSTSKLYQFENLPEPRNATEEEREAFYSKSYNFYIPDNIDDFGKSVNQRDSDTLVNKDVQINYYKEEIMQRRSKNIDIDDEVQNNPNLHSEEQDELEILDNTDVFINTTISN